jgi:hypothetical protein
MRNELCFQGVSWTGMHRLLRKSVKMVRDWRLLNKPEDAGKLRVGKRVRKEKLYHQDRPGNQHWANIL